MNKKDFEYYEIIDNYFDAVLSKEEEIILFTALSQNDQAREHFKQRNVLQQVISAATEDVPNEVDEEILKAVKVINIKRDKRVFIQTYLPVFAYAASIILLLLSIFFFTRTRGYEKKVDTLTQAVSKQNETIELLLNSLPPVRIQSARENKIIINPN